MQIIDTSVMYSLVDTSDLDALLVVIAAPLDLARQPALFASEFILVLFNYSLVVVFLTIGGDKQVLDAKVDANHLVCRRQRLMFRLYKYGNKVFSCWCLRYRCPFDLPDKRTTQSSFNKLELRKLDFILTKQNFDIRNRNTRRIRTPVSVFASEFWITRMKLKETLIGIVHREYSLVECKLINFF